MLPEGLMGVMGDTWELACVEGWGEGLIGERLVGEVTEREERLREREVEGLVSTMDESLRADCDDCWDAGW